MQEVIYVPLFPLNLLPFPGELVPLHIFEPRYRQLIADSEPNEKEFGIFALHPANTERFGTMVRIERIIRRHRGGESDIIVRAGRMFSMLEMDKYHPGKTYPGGLVQLAETSESSMTDPKLLKIFERFQRSARVYQRSGPIGLFDIAVALGFSLEERLFFAGKSDRVRKVFLRRRLQYELKLAEAAARSREVFHLN